MDQLSMSALFRVEELDSERIEALQKIKIATRELAETYNNILPEVGEKQVALQNLYGALTSAKQAIELHGVSHTQSPIVMVKQ